MSVTYTYLPLQKRVVPVQTRVMAGLVIAGLSFAHVTHLGAQADGVVHIGNATTQHHRQPALPWESLIVPCR